MCRRLFTIRRYTSCRTVVGPHCPTDQITESFYLCDMATAVSISYAHDTPNEACYTVAVKSPTDGLEYCLGGLKVEFDTEFEDISGTCEAESCRTLKRMKKEWKQRTAHRRERMEVGEHSSLEARGHSRGRRRSPRVGTNSRKNNPEQNGLEPDKAGTFKTVLTQDLNPSASDTMMCDPASGTSWFFSEYTIRATELEDLDFMSLHQLSTSTLPTGKRLGNGAGLKQASGSDIRPSEDRTPCLSKELVISQGFLGDQESTSSDIPVKSPSTEYSFPRHINSRIIEAAFTGFSRHPIVQPPRDGLRRFNRRRVSKPTPREKD